MRNDILDLVRKLCNLYYNGIFEDLMLIKGGADGISIKVSSTEDFINQVANCGYDSFVVRLPGKLRYTKPIYLPSISSYRLNRKSLVLERVPLNTCVGSITQSDIRIRW